MVVKINGIGKINSIVKINRYQSENIQHSLTRHYHCLLKFIMFFVFFVSLNLTNALRSLWYYWGFLSEHFVFDNVKKNNRWYHYFLYNYIYYPFLLLQRLQFFKWFLFGKYLRLRFSIASADGLSSWRYIRFIHLSQFLIVDFRKLLYIDNSLNISKWVDRHAFCV